MCPYEATFIDGSGNVVKKVVLADGVRDFDVTPPGVPAGTVFFHREGWEGRNDVGLLMPGGDHWSIGNLEYTPLRKGSHYKPLGVEVRGDFLVQLFSGNGDINGKVEMRFRRSEKI